MNKPYKIKDKKTGKYRLAKNGMDSINTSLGSINGRALIYSANDVEIMKANEDQVDKTRKD